jgi:hypothetical protein
MLYPDIKKHCDRAMYLYDALPKDVRDVLKEHPVTERDTLWLYNNMNSIPPNILLDMTKTMAKKEVMIRRARYPSSGIY